MLKVPNRTQRSKGFKVKHFIQACLLLAVCVWLLNQVKHYYEKTTVSGEAAGTTTQAPAMITQRESVKLGRKDLDPNVQVSSFDTKTNVQTEESTQHESETKGGDDDDDGMDGHDDVEKTEDDEPEEVEDLIDEEDREKEDEVEEEEEEEDHGQYESQRKSRKAREENYKGDDASSDVVHNKEKMFDRKDDQTSLTDSVIDSSSKEVAENEKEQKSERNARLLLMENLSVS